MTTPEFWQHPSFTSTTQAKGRNGWFALAAADLFVGQHHAWLDLLSKRLGKSAPVSLRFETPDDMRTLGHALLAAADAFEDKKYPDVAIEKALFRTLAEDDRRDGELEFDDRNIVSINGEGNAYVQAWWYVHGPAQDEEEDPDMQGPDTDADPQVFLDFWHGGHADDHWSSPNGCHEQCPRCAQAQVQP